MYGALWQDKHKFPDGGWGRRRVLCVCVGGGGGGEGGGGMEEDHKADQLLHLRSENDRLNFYQEFCS